MLAEVVERHAEVVVEESEVDTVVGLVDFLRSEQRVSACELVALIVHVVGIEHAAVAELVVVVESVREAELDEAYPRLDALHEAFVRCNPCAGYRWGGIPAVVGVELFGAAVGHVAANEVAVFESVSGGDAHRFALVGQYGCARSAFGLEVLIEDISHGAYIVVAEGVLVVGECREVQIVVHLSGLGIAQRCVLIAAEALEVYFVAVLHGNPALIFLQCALVVVRAELVCHHGRCREAFGHHREVGVEAAHRQHVGFELLDEARTVQHAVHGVGHTVDGEYLVALVDDVAFLVVDNGRQRAVHCGRKLEQRGVNTGIGAACCLHTVYAAADTHHGAQPAVDFDIDVGAEIESVYARCGIVLPVFVFLGFERRGFVHIVDVGIVLQALCASGKRHSGTGHPHSLVEQVVVRIVGVVGSAVTVDLFLRELREFAEAVVVAGLVAQGGILGRRDGVGSLGALLQSLVEVDRNFVAAYAAALGADYDRAVTSLHAVDSHCRSIFENSHCFDFLRSDIHVVPVRAYLAVDDDEGLVAVGCGEAADNHCQAVVRRRLCHAARFAVIFHHGKSRQTSGKGLAEVRLRRLGKLGAAYHGYRAGKFAAGNFVVAKVDNLVERAGGFAHGNNAVFSGFAYGDCAGFVADKVIVERLAAVGNGNFIVAVDVGHSLVSIVGGFDHGACDGYAVRVEDGAAYFQRICGVLSNGGGRCHGYCCADGNYIDSLFHKIFHLGICVKDPVTIRGFASQHRCCFGVVLPLRSKGAGAGRGCQRRHEACSICCGVRT
ncbi:hypothetical protein IMSAGC008_01223 [Muribaculaceae bacterium]|nr:hypothetical protein IMSAGC008_01223 [Muribaculaceae bacterium]